MIHSILGEFANSTKTEEYFEAAQEHVARCMLEEREKEGREMVAEFESYFGTIKLERCGPDDVKIYLVRRKREFFWSRDMLGSDPTKPSAEGKG